MVLWTLGQPTKHLLAKGLLEEYGINITEIAREILTLWHRDEEIRVIETLNRRTKKSCPYRANQVLVNSCCGRSGSEDVDGAYPYKLQGKQVIRPDVVRPSPK